MRRAARRRYLAQRGAGAAAHRPRRLRLCGFLWAARPWTPRARHPAARPHGGATRRAARQRGAQCESGAPALGRRCTRCSRAEATAAPPGIARNAGVNGAHLGTKRFLRALLQRFRVLRRPRLQVLNNQRAQRRQQIHAAPQTLLGGEGRRSVQCHVSGRGRAAACIVHTVFTPQPWSARMAARQSL